MFPGSWKKTEYANPGAENYAYIPNMTLPAFPYFGVGTPVASAGYSVMQSPQVMSRITIPTAGYGGLIAGQFIGQPLSR